MLVKSEKQWNFCYVMPSQPASRSHQSEDYCAFLATGSYKWAGLGAKKPVSAPLPKLAKMTSLIFCSGKGLIS